jgi:hypothetical protein
MPVTNNYTIRSSKQPIIKTGLRGLTIARSTDMTYLASNRENLCLTFKEILHLLNFIVNEVSYRDFDNRLFKEMKLLLNLINP